MVWKLDKSKRIVFKIVGFARRVKERGSCRVKERGSFRVKERGMDGHAIVFACVSCRCIS